MLPELSVRICARPVSLSGWPYTGYNRVVGRRSRMLSPDNELAEYRCWSPPSYKVVKVTKSRTAVGVLRLGSDILVRFEVEVCCDWTGYRVHVLTWKTSGRRLFVSTTLSLSLFSFFVCCPTTTSDGITFPECERNRLSDSLS